ncbi:carbohydrate-binding module family 1 protein [Baudoinia panamericana UAMH 10762]|uniref:Glucanase n=1 Tax=Baudoinia panamericana (strain UAMH 10762) TaxID=717646 RepID=M2N728_BAUPA|nr:carbohydrate-binding module family 1 protein [Baudoinia panamericana UAMH 10762]EMC99908.1 carbohydrate-binding module family 1 protein [Baudoinia panamericana UAMH 10762]
MSSLALSILALGALVRGQQAGTLTAEVHPPLTVSNCTANGCTTESHTIVLDANWRWLHSTTGSTNCYNGNTWDATLCPDPVTCAANCALDGGNYASTYGITTSGNSLSLGFKTGSNVGSRVYLMDTSDSQYQVFHLKNREFTFDVDVSGIGCGINGALYFVEMYPDGGLSEYSGNKAGAKYGTGYCDSQCPQDIKFINGKANINGWTPASNNANTGSGGSGSCCNEMDIWEANSVSAALTPHVCSVNGQTICSTNTTCGAGSDRYTGYCDKDGCDFNSYRMGNHTFYGPGDTVDTKSKFTVVTQFITSDGTDAGKLSEIRRFYVQNGKVISNSASDVAGVSGNSITDSFCAAQKTAFNDTNEFAAKGGLAAMGAAFDRGMELVISIWDDYAVDMLWLDSDYPTTADPGAPGVARGTCATTSGVPSDVESQQANAKVIFSNIKVGTLCSTFSGGNCGASGTGGSSSSSSSIASSSRSTSSTAASTSSRTSSTSVPPSSTRTSSTSTRGSSTASLARVSTSSTRTSSISSSSSSPTGTSVAQHYGQCGRQHHWPTKFRSIWLTLVGGIGWNGPTSCASPYTCTVSNAYYSQLVAWNLGYCGRCRWNVFHDAGRQVCSGQCSTLSRDCLAAQGTWLR